MSSTATDTTSNATGAANDATKSLAGGRKPGDLVPSDTTKGATGAVTGATGGVLTKDEEEKSSLKIHIKLDLDVEVHLTARVKGDIVIGLL